MAVASGALLSFTFPNARLWPLVFVALVPLLVILSQGTKGPAEPGRTSRGVRWSPWIAGIVFNVLMFWWIVRLPVHAMTHPWIIWPALGALGLYLGLYFALFGWAVRFLQRRSVAPLSASCTGEPCRVAHSRYSKKGPTDEG